MQRIAATLARAAALSLLVTAVVATLCLSDAVALAQVPASSGKPGDPPGPSGPQDPGQGPVSPSPFNPFNPFDPFGPFSPFAEEFHVLLEDSWRGWWQYNREPFLRIKEHVSSGTPGSGGDDFFIGHGESEVPEELTPTAEQVRELVLPLLRRQLGSETNPDALCATLLALARVAASHDALLRAEIEREMRPHVASPNRLVSEAAVIALGVLGHDASVLLLAELAADGEPGRAAIGHSAVDARRRALAAYSLGLLGRRTGKEDVRRYAIHRLVEVLRDDDTGSQDLPVAIVIALGLIPLAEDFTTAPREQLAADSKATPATSRLGTARFLLSLLRERDAAPLAQAHAPVSVARLARGLSPPSYEALKSAAASELVGILSPRSRARTELVQGAALALGQLGDDDADGVDVAIRGALIAVIGEGKDVSTRQLAMLALAETGARAGRGPEPGSGAEPIQRRLLKELEHGKTNERPFAGLAAAIFGRGRSIATLRVASPDIARGVRAALEDARSNEETAAYCVALGILHDLASSELMYRRFATSLEDDVRGYASIGLGMVGELRATNPVRFLVQEAKHRPQLLRQASIGSALLGDARVVPELLDMLREANVHSSEAAAAQALGLVGDARAIEPLLELIRDEGTSGATRALATTALGQIAERERLPWSTHLTTGLNYRARTETLSAVVGAGARAPF